MPPSPILYSRLTFKYNYDKQLVVLPYLHLKYELDSNDISEENEEAIINQYKEKTLDGLRVFDLDKDFKKKYLK